MAVKTIQAEPFSGEETIKMVKNLIRYDIPFLLLGKSSIGKSYSITELAEEFRAFYLLARKNLQI